jgi:hypothetical protein
MAGRDFLAHLFSRVLRSTAMLVLLGVCLAAASTFSLGLGLIHRRTSPTAAAETAADQVVVATERASAQTVLGEFEGSFDYSSRSLRLSPASSSAAGSKSSRGYRLQSRSDANTPLPGGSFSVRLTDTNGPGADSIFLNNVDAFGIVSAEVEIINNSSYTFYNTRLVFTNFNVGSASGAVAQNTPASPTGLAFYNDGQVVCDGKLCVSRNYGDIASGGSAKAIWTFSVPTSGPTFHFRFKILADLGLATESVRPAAVQVTASTGSSVTIRGRGFTGTPTVSLLDSNGNVAANLNVNSASATQLSVDIPAGTAPGIYSLRVTNPGGTPGGVGSSTLNGRLTVTGQPDAAHTLSGAINNLSDTGPYLITSNATISSEVVILPGTVIYFASGATLQIAAGGNLTANGGIPGVPNGAGIATPKQIVFTAQRAPGATVPSPGAWGGIDATSGSSATMTFRNCVIEYGGATGGAQINISNSGRTLRFTDSISRLSNGSGIAASGPNDRLIGFARSWIEGNNDVAIKLSANAALGLYDLDGTTGGTSVGDANFYYSSANIFADNAINAVQIGVDDQLNSNDFTRSGVLVGQGETPIQIRGSSTNPAIIGNTSFPTGAELSINPGALIQLAPGTDLQAGDLARGIFGAIAANGLAGVTQVPGAAFGSSRYIDFDRIPGNSNFGALIFSRNATASSILNYVRVQNGGSSSVGAAAVIADGVSIQIRNSQINNSSTGSILQLAGGSVQTLNTTFTGNGVLIDTVAGGRLGDGNLARQAHLVTPVAAVADPQGRGLYLVDATGGANLIRFLNTGTSTVTIAGQTILPGTINTIAGGGNNLLDNVPALEADLGSITGLALSLDGKLLYFIDAIGSLVRVINISSNPVTVAGASIGPANVGTFSSGPGFGSSLRGLAVHPMTGDLYVVDATAGVNKVFKVDASGNATVFAGNGADTRPDEALQSGSAATGVPLLQPHALEIDSSGTVYIADTGHSRIVRVPTSGADSGKIFLVAQFPTGSLGPFPSGMTIHNGKLYIANGNEQTIVRLDGGQSRIAGQPGTACDYSTSNCGDGGPAVSAGLNLLGSTSNPPLAGIEADANGIFILDQGGLSRGRVRYINLSAATVTLAGVQIAPGAINTVAGTGLSSPYDGGPAIGASLNAPTGVVADANNNLWITDTLRSILRFVNRGSSAITLFPGTAAAQTVAPGTIVTVNKDVAGGAGANTTVNQAAFDTPQGITATSQGIFIADSKRGQTVPVGFQGQRTGLIEFINTSSATVVLYPNSVAPISIPPGHIFTIAGGSLDSGSIGNGNFALNARFNNPADVAVSPLNGDIYIADVGNKAVRKIDRNSGIVSSVLTGSQFTGLGFDTSGRLYVANFDTNHVLRETSPGSGQFAQMDTGSGLNKPRDVAVDAAGNAYVTNSGDHTIRKISPDGTVTLFAGISSTSGGSRGDQVLATAAELNIAPPNVVLRTTGTLISLPATVNITISPTGEILFADSNNNRIRRLR